MDCLLPTPFLIGRCSLLRYHSVCFCTHALNPAEPHPPYNSARRLGEEERIFLDAIRGLRENQQQASTQAHSSDHGSAASDSSGDEEGGAGGGVGGVAVARQEEEEEEGETGAAGGALPLKKRRV